MIPSNKLLLVSKKSAAADLERRRKEMFLVAVVIILSVIYCILSWDMSVAEVDNVFSIDDILEDLDLDHLRRDVDVVAAITEVPMVEEVTQVVVAADEQPDELLAAEDTGETGDDDAMDAAETVDDTSQQTYITPLNDSESLVVAEQLPQFPGGATAFMKWITANVTYPKTAQDKKIEGRVVVSFIIGIDGKATDITIEASPDALLSALVLGVMQRMPAWQPGIADGKLTPTMVRVPINFQL